MHPYGYRIKPIWRRCHPVQRSLANILHHMFREQLYKFWSKLPSENTRNKDAALPADKNSTGQKDQYSVKNLDSEDFHLRLDK